jgi:hypothetical protein
VQISFGQSKKRANITEGSFNKEKSSLRRSSGLEFTGRS